MKLKSLILPLGLLVLGSAPHALAQEVLGPLSGTVDSQLVQGWKASEEGGWFVLRNDSIEGSEQTLAINAGPPPADGREITVNVTLNSKIPEAAIGLVARSATNNDICLMEITAEAKGNLFCVIGGEQKSIASVANAARLDGSDTITMVEVPGAARFFINDTQIGDVTFASALGAEIGVMAYERGTFGVADFAITGPEASTDTGSGLPPKGGGTGTGLPPKGGSGGGAAPGTASGGGNTASGSGDTGNKMAAIMGPLADTISNAADKDGWELFFEKDWLVLVNSAKASSELVYKMPVGPLNSGERITRVDVAVLPPQGQKSGDFPASAVGILIEDSAGTASCLGEITGAGDGVLICFGADGKGREIGRLAGAAKGGGNDVLELVERPGIGEFRLNGQVIGQVQDNPALGGDIGVLAYERGEFYVGGFSISSGAGSASSGTPASSGAPSPSGTASSGPVPMFGGDEARLIGVYLGLTNSIFMHEFGHALIGELQIPSTGPEEDSVDIFSALKVIEPTMYPSGDTGVDAIGREVATYSALQWYYSGKLAEQQGGETPWQDEHTPDLKRFRNVFCVMYGGNPAIFENLAEQIGFDDRTLSRCEGEFNKQNRAWRAILAPHTRVDTWFPEGQLPADAPGAKVEVIFESTNSEIGKFLTTAFGDGLRGFADNLAKNYALPRPITVTYKDCGELNAWYDPQEGTITMCYDLIEHLAIMISDIEMGTQQGIAGDIPQSGTAKTAEVANTNIAAPSGSANAIDELADLGVPITSVLFPAPYNGPTPVNSTKAQVMTTAELTDALNKGTQMLLIDTSGQAETIPGAVTVVDAGKDGSLTDRFQNAVNDWLKQETASDAKMPVVFFGKGLQDRSSYNGALRAGALGWNAFWYRGGAEAWKSNGLPLVAAE